MLMTRPITIDTVTERYGDLPYMKETQAKFLQKFITDNDISDILELGFFHGKSTAYIASILEELGRGHVTTIDLKSAMRRSPPITEVIAELRLEHRVSPILAPRSFTWEMQKMLADDPVPQFDFIYIDGGHTWDGTGFGFFLADLLLKPGGWIIFDDMNWTAANSVRGKDKIPEVYKNFTKGEMTAKTVRRVWDLLVPRRGYINMHEETQFSWGIAQKPHEQG